jgi:GntR family transcriptional regulator
VLDFKVIKATTEVTSKLEIQPDDKVIFLHRRRFANSEPIVVIKTYLPYNRCAFILDHDFTKELLYSVLSQDESVKVCYVKRLVEAVEATSTDIKYLGIKSRIPIQFFTSVGYNIYGQPIEYSLARYRGDRNSFEVTVFVEK